LLMIEAFMWLSITVATASVKHCKSYN